MFFDRLVASTEEIVFCLAELKPVLLLHRERFERDTEKDLSEERHPPKWSKRPMLFHSVTVTKVGTKLLSLDKHRKLIFSIKKNRQRTVRSLPSERGVEQLG